MSRWENGMATGQHHGHRFLPPLLTNENIWRHRSVIELFALPRVVPIGTHQWIPPDDSQCACASPTSAFCTFCWWLNSAVNERQHNDSLVDVTGDDIIIRITFLQIVCPLTLKASNIGQKYLVYILLGHLLVAHWMPMDISSEHCPHKKDTRAALQISRALYGSEIMAFSSRWKNGFRTIPKPSICCTYACFIVRLVKLKIMAAITSELNSSSLKNFSSGHCPRKLWSCSHTLPQGQVSSHPSNWFPDVLALLLSHSSRLIRACIFVPFPAPCQPMRLFHGRTTKQCA